MTLTQRQSLILLELFISFSVLSSILKCYQLQNESSIYLKNCMYRHDKCIFLMGAPHSGVERLMDILVQHPQVKIQGNNAGIFSKFIRGYRHNGGREQQRNYTDFVKAGLKHSISWYNPESIYDFEVALMQLFNEWYVKGSQKSDIVGFIEQSYGLDRKDYMYFKLDMMLLTKLCKRPKVILYLNQDFRRVVKHVSWYSRFPHPVAILKRINDFYQRFFHETPQSTFIVSQQNFSSNSTMVLDAMFQFLDVEYNISRIQLNRFVSYDLSF